MKKRRIVPMLCILFTAFSVHSYAATTVTNETGTSSMYGLNGQFEHYNEKQIVKKPILMSKKLTLKLQQKNKRFAKRQ